MTFSAAISDLFKSVYEAFAGVFRLVYDVLHGIVSAILGTFVAVFHFITDTLEGAVAFAGGIGKFVIGNFAVLAVIAVAAFFYIQQQQQQGKSPTAPIKAQVNGNGTSPTKSKKAVK